MLSKLSNPNRKTLYFFLGVLRLLQDIGNGKAHKININSKASTVTRNIVISITAHEDFNPPSQRWYFHLGEATPLDS